MVPGRGCARGQLHTLDSAGPFAAKALLQGLGMRQGNSVKVLRQAFTAAFKHRHGVGAQIDNSAKQFALANRPGHGHARHAQFALDFVQDVQRLAHFAVHFVDEGDDGRIALAANLDQAAGLRLHAIGRVNHHQRCIHGGEHAVGIFRKVFVSGCVQKINHMVAVHHLHHAGRHRNAALLFDLHPVRCRMARSLARLHRPSNLNRAGKQQELFCQCGFTRVGVGNDRKGATAAGFGGEGQSGGFQWGGAGRAENRILEVCFEP